MVDDWASSQRSVVRTEVALLEVCLVTFPAYAGALVGGVRSAQLDELEHRLAALTGDTSASPVLPVDVARRRLLLLSLESPYQHV